jgi:GNAT superfamily N-acetyltransferase
MTFSDGYTDLPLGKIASVVTFLEMRQRPIAAATQPPAGLSIRHLKHPSLERYRNLYRAVGQDWMWFSRLRMSDEELLAIIHDSRVHVYVLSDGDEDKGLLELDGRTESEVEIAYLGVTADMLGRGTGQYLMGQALSAAWDGGVGDSKIDRVWVHTCTLDHPRALAFYLKAGFIPYKRAIEVTDDPRLTAEAPLAVAPHIPTIGRRDDTR